MDLSKDKIQFISELDGSASVTMTLPADANLGEVLEAFEAFLRASGYEFYGEVNIVDDSEYDDSLIYDPKAEEN